MLIVIHEINEKKNLFPIFKKSLNNKLWPH